jgi:DNA polymerase (family X)
MTMENLEISSVLDRLADLLEIQGANPFRVRAYRNAVRTVQGLTRPLGAMVADGEDLTELPGIGKELAGHIRELLDTGRLEVLEEVAREVPASLAELMRLDGVGPKKARRLWEELGVTSVEELEAALGEGRVEVLEGFGQKSAEKMARAIRDLRKHMSRFLLSDADELVLPLVRYLMESPGVERVEVAGSYRRRRETVGDVDVLVLCDDDPGPLMERFTGYPGAERVEAAGETRGRILLTSGLPVDIRVVPRESFGAALHYFTGSKEHNVALRALGVKKGLRINEYGVFRGGSEEKDESVGGGGEGRDGAEAGGEEGRDEVKAGGKEVGRGSAGERIGGGREEDVFRAVDLPWIPPLLRENRGELEAAREGRLPDIVSLEDIRGDLQMHSTWSDGKNTVREMVEACRELGYEYLSLTDHSQAVTVARGLRPERVRAQWEETDEVRREVQGIRLFRSLEIDILKDGSLDMPDDILEELDLVLVSVHSFMDMERSAMTRRVIRAMEHPEVDILAHPTGRILNRRSPFELDVEEVLQAAASLDVAVELNAHPKRLDLHDLHLRRAKELGVKVAINTDAHSTKDLKLMRYGVDQACRGWLEPGDVLNAMSLPEMEAWKGRKRTA